MFISEFYACFFVIFFSSDYTLQVSSALKNEAVETFDDGMLYFGANLSRVLHRNNQKEGNILFSPINIYAALLLVHLGSDSTTRLEIDNVLRIDIPERWPGVHEKFNLLFDRYNLNLTDVVFFDTRTTLNEKFVKLARCYYNSDIIGVNFSSEKFKVFEAINQYIVNKIGNRVSRFYHEPQTQFPNIILANCLNYKSSWRFPFRASTTRWDTFYTRNGPVSVKMMQRVGNMTYANLSWLASEVACLKANPNISLFVVLPYEHLGLRYLLDNFVADDFHRILEDVVETHRVDFKLPRTTLKWSENLVETLSKFGAKEIFTPQANLQRMIKDGYFDVNQIKCVAGINITEYEIEASSVTAVRISPSKVVEPSYLAAKEQSIAELFNDAGVALDENRWEQFADLQFHVNRPFFMFMYSHDVNTVMFYVAVNNPRGDPSD